MQPAHAHTHTCFHARGVACFVHDSGAALAAANKPALAPSHLRNLQDSVESMLNHHVGGPGKLGTCSEVLEGSQVSGACRMQNMHPVMSAT